MPNVHEPESAAVVTISQSIASLLLGCYGAALITDMRPVRFYVTLIASQTFHSTSPFSDGYALAVPGYAH